MSGLRINYEKSEIFVLGVEHEEQVRVANLFNCVIGEFPMKYLGIKVSPRKWLASDLEYVVEKFRKNWVPGNQLLQEAGRF